MVDVTLKVTSNLGMNRHVPYKVVLVYIINACLYQLTKYRYLQEQYIG